MSRQIFLYQNVTTDYRSGYLKKKMFNFFFFISEFVELFFDDHFGEKIFEIHLEIDLSQSGIGRNRTDFRNRTEFRELRNRTESDVFS